MVLVEIDQSKRLLVLNAAGHVTGDEVKQAANQVREALRSAEPGVRALADFRALESMQPASIAYIAEIMEELANQQVASVIRIIRNPGYDVPFNILSEFRC